MRQKYYISLNIVRSSKNRNMWRKDGTGLGKVENTQKVTREG